MRILPDSLTVCASSLLFAAISTLAEIPSLFGQRPIVLRHRKAAMYHPFVEALALTLVDVPMTFITIAVFSLVLYFVVGLQQSPAQFLCVLSPSRAGCVLMVRLRAARSSCSSSR